MIVENKTYVSKEHIYSKIKTNFNKRIYVKYIYIFLLIIIGIAVIIMAIRNGSPLDSIIIGCLFLICSLIFLYINIKNMLEVPKNIEKKFSDFIKFDNLNCFFFKEESMSLNIIINNKNYKLEEKYCNFKRIIDYNNVILFIPKNSEYFYVCDKDGFKNKKELELFYYGLRKHKIKIKVKKINYNHK